MPAVNNIAALLGLSVMVCDADHYNFEKALIELTGPEHK
jgi:hypothetical protein